MIVIVIVVVESFIPPAMTTMVGYDCSVEVTITIIKIMSVMILFRVEEMDQLYQVFTRW